MTKKNYVFTGIALAVLLVTYGAIQRLIHIREEPFQRTCLANVYTLSHSMLLYSSDNDGFPATESWMDDIFQYLEPTSSLGALHCPAVGDAEKEFGYAMHITISGRKPSSLPDPSFEPIVFDSSLLSRNAASEQVLEPRFSRHGGQMFGYADGHVTRFTLRKGSE